MSYKKTILIILILVIIIAAVAVMYRSTNEPAPNNETTADQVVTKTELEVGDNPSGLTNSLPIEAGSQIIQNFETNSGDGRMQGTRKFTSFKTFPEIIKTYQDYFVGKSWEVVDEQSGSDFQAVMLKRNRSTVLVVAKKDPRYSDNMVEITLTEQEMEVK